MEELGSLKGVLGWLTVFEEILGVLGEFDGLVLGSEESHALGEVSLSGVSRQHVRIFYI